MVQVERNSLACLKLAASGRAEVTGAIRGKAVVTWCSLVGQGLVMVMAATRDFEYRLDLSEVTARLISGGMGQYQFSLFYNPNQTHVK